MKTRMKTTFTQTVLSRVCLGASAVVLCMGAAQAADPATRSIAPTFSQLDTNHDGYIDAKEASASPEVSSWIGTAADQDKDGKLSLKEFTAAIAVMPVEK